MTKVAWETPATLAKEWGLSQSNIQKVASDASIPTREEDGSIYMPAVRAFAQDGIELSNERGVGALNYALKNLVSGKHRKNIGVVLDEHSGNRRYYSLKHQITTKKYNSQFVKTHFRRELTRKASSQCDFEIGNVISDPFKPHYCLFLCESIHQLWCIDRPTLVREFERVCAQNKAERKEAKERGDMFKVVYRIFERGSSKRVPHLNITLTAGADYAVTSPADVGL